MAFHVKHHTRRSILGSVKTDLRVNTVNDILGDVDQIKPKMGARIRDDAHHQGSSNIWRFSFLKFKVVLLITDADCLSQYLILISSTFQSVNQLFSSRLLSRKAPILTPGHSHHTGPTDYRAASSDQDEDGAGAGGHHHSQ